MTTKNQNNLQKLITNAKMEKITVETKNRFELFLENYVLMMAIFMAIVIMLIIYFTSKTFVVGRNISQMKLYHKFQEISSYPYAKYGQVPLVDCKISSSYNSAHSGYQMFGYLSEKTLLIKMQSGARYLEFNVFNSEFGDNAYPVVSNGYKTGEWKLTLNKTPLEDCLKVIVDNAFITKNYDEGTPNFSDPIFIGLNLNTNNNVACLNKIADLIIKYFSDRLLPSKYSFQNSDDLPKVKLSELMERVVILSSDGFQGTRLEEIVNYSWDNVNDNEYHKMQRLHIDDITVMNESEENNLVEFNKSGITIVVPNKEGDFYSNNYNPVKPFELGCQFVAMNFQKIDREMDIYITEFKDKCILLKPKLLRSL